MADETTAVFQKKEFTKNNLSEQDKKDIMGLVSGMLKRSKQDKTKLEQRWHLYDKYIIGQQHERRSFNPITGFTGRKLSYDVSYPTTNFLLVNYEIVLGKFIKYTPKPIARAHSNNFDDRKASEMADAFIDHRYREDFDGLKLSPYYRMLLAYGTVARKVYYDKTAGKWDTSPDTEKVPGKVDKTVSECKICGAKYDKKVEECAQCGNGSEAIDVQKIKIDGMITKETKKKVPVGTIKTSVIHPRYLYVDPMSRYWEMGSWMFEKQFRSISWIYNQYKDVYIPKEEILEHAVDFQTIMSQTNDTDTAPAEELVESIIPTYEFYLKPGRMSQFPNGMYMVMTEEQPLWIDVENGIPYNDPEYVDQDFPYSFAVYRPITDRFYGEGLLDSMLTIQDQINTSDLHRMKYRKLGIMPKLLAPDTSRIKPSLMQGNEIEAFYYKANPLGGQPHFMQLPNLPPTLWDDRGALIDDMANLAGAKDLTSNISDRTSGRALNLKMENFEDRLRPDLKQLEHAEVQYHKKKLITAKLHMSHKQLVTVYGEDGSIRAKEFKMADIKGGFDILVDLGSMLNRSFSLVASNIFDLADRGFIDPYDAKVKHRVLRKFGLEELVPDYSQHVNRAEYENTELRKGIQVPIQKFDNHALHKEEHMSLYLSDDFLTMNAETQNAILEHITEHEDAIREEQERQMQQQMALKGGQPVPQEGMAEEPPMGMGGSETLPTEVPEQMQPGFGQGMTTEGQPPMDGAPQMAQMMQAGLG